ncbi:MAG TPA: sugar phosphate isomerase/epimerase family protein [Anaerolineaceae bacterium]|nr:sugar phosphate isomerase/epimerase family protein [Anaerolineaceae bacterium]
MYFTGFADEAGDSIEVQIKATLELGWNFIESRSVNNTNISDISEREFDTVCEKLEKSNVNINCFGSAIANWSKDPRDEAGFQENLESLRRAIARMKRLGTKYLRGMSFKIVKDVEPDSPEIEKHVFKKLSLMVKMCEDADVFFLHENCMNYGGLSYVHTLRLLDKINSPNFKLVFDTGNPVGTDNRIGKPPYKKQSSWEFYSNVREFIEYVHIKDCVFINETDQIFPELDFTFPGDGHGDVRRIVHDLLKNGYDGGFSIEPHLSVVHHDQSEKPVDLIRYQNYVEYGKRFMNLYQEENAMIR